MAFCKACGQDAGDASFCPKCGAAQGAPAGGAQGAAVASAASSAADFPTAGIDENVAGLLCYIFWWVSGLIFLLIDKRPFVRFHAAQDIAFNIVMAIVMFVFWIIVIVLTFVTAFLHIPIGILTVFLWPVVGFAFLGTWIFLMYKAYNHEMFKLPVIGDMVERMLNK